MKNKKNRFKLTEVIDIEIASFSGVSLDWNWL